ncbi:uncharacterized protein LOC131660062 [Vicia villosa]|uniref:uncharacterized protein LOC131660062 n=1 Tax=Vicia villosa TaxID=3911 RepID=UPI00273B4766|nr:uncharacterized protein LOC131660062 [Vicia villosa]
MNSVATIFPSSYALLYRYHITKNVRSRVKPAVGTEHIAGKDGKLVKAGVIVEKIMDAWNVIINASTKELYADVVIYFRTIMLLKYFTPEPRFPEPKKLAPSNGHPEEPSSVPSSNGVQPEPHSSYKVFKKGLIWRRILEKEVKFLSIIQMIKMSVEKDVVFCLPCYVCYNGTSNSAFVVTGFKGWNLKHKLDKHVGEKTNSHNKKCVKACEDLMKKKHSIEFSYAKYSSKEVDYLFRLKASLEAVKYLVRGGLAFRAHNEGKNSICKGHFLESVEALGRNSEKIAAAITSGGGNCKMTSPIIQKELANACAVETIKKIVGEIGDGFFCVLVDEFGDCSGKEQMAVVVRFVDVRGFVVERFIGIVHVEDTSAISLKGALECLLSGFGLCISKIRGQGYDGANNMHGQFGVSRIVTFLWSSNKRQALLRNKQVAHFANLIEKELVETGTGLNQELSIARAGDTRWGSHFRTLNRLVDLFTPIIEVFEDLKSDSHSKGEPKSLLLGDQDIVHAMELVQICKKKLQEFRDDGWETLYEQVVAFCGNVEIDVPDMESRYVKDKKSKRIAPFVINFHYFKNDCFLHVIDVVLKELNDWFTPENIEFINCVACLSPCYSFESFDVKSLVRLARLYPNDFEDLTDKELSNELETYIESVKMDDHFPNLTGISKLCRTFVRTKKHKTFRFVYTLVKLALSLPVATASVKRVFSGMKYVKNELRSRMANPWLNDCLVTFVEKEMFNTIDDMDIIKRFQGMNKRRMHLRLN